MESEDDSVSISRNEKWLLDCLPSCSCAGVCSYEGRGGLCSVRLSVPLLKLRPRKDLVETLLVSQSFFSILYSS